MSRASWYALPPGGWRDYVTLLHVPYTLWHLSYVVIGAALAPVWLPGRLGATLAAFALALGIGAHALDELRGRPLATQIPDRVLWLLAAGSIARCRRHRHRGGHRVVAVAARVRRVRRLHRRRLQPRAVRRRVPLRPLVRRRLGSVPAAHCLCHRRRDDHARRRRRSRVRSAAEPCPATPLDTRAPREKARAQHVRLTRARRRRDARRSRRRC